MNDNKDHEFNSHFEQLRHADAANTPAFEAVVQQKRAARIAARRPASRARAVLALVAAASVVLTIGVIKSAKQRSVVSVEVLSKWRPRSDVLLESGTSTLSRIMPPLSKSVLDTIVQ